MIKKISKKKKRSKILSDLSGVAAYLEKAGYPKGAAKVYEAMSALDGMFSDDEDYIVDSITSSIPDVQNALPGSMPYALHGGSGGSPSLLNPGESTLVELANRLDILRLIKVANKLDQEGLYDEADAIDKILEELLSDKDFRIIEDLEEKEGNKKKQKAEPAEEDKEGKDVLVQSNGLVPTSVSQTSGFSGLSDAYFYTQYGNLEGAYGPQ